MLTIRKENFRDDEINVILDGLVPENHLVRKIENAIDFSFIYDKVKDLYSPLGAPSIDPVVLIKIVLIQYLFGIPSMRQTIREIEVNVAYRWFLGYSLTEKIPHFSTFNKNYERRFKNTDLFESIFKEILARATKCGFVDSSNIYIDSTHIKASANKKKYTKVEVDIQAKHYQEKLEKEINEDRLKHGKSPLCEVKNEEVKKKEKIESNTDKDSGMFFKNEKEKCFAYLAHTACDNNNFILDFHITSGNIHDSVAFSDLYQKIKNNSKQHTTAIAIDAGYITPYICKTILDDGIIPAIPYKRPMTKKGFFKKYEYVYDEYYDCYICPNNKILKYSTTNRDGYREYKSNPSDCKSCEHLNICTNSKNKQKLVTRHIWQNYLEEADHLRHKPYVKKVYSKLSKPMSELNLPSVRRRYYPVKTKLSAVRDRVINEMGYAEVLSKYEVKPSTFHVWLHKYKSRVLSEEQHKRLSSRNYKMLYPMTDQERAELETLRQEVEKQKILVEAYELMLELARERLHVDVKKNYEEMLLAGLSRDRKNGEVKP